jgi:hypothetical protein
MQYDDIFQQACLLQLCIKTWTGAKKLPPYYVQRIGESDWIKGRKNLVDPDYLQPLKTTACKARTFVKKQALPFPIHGLSLVPKETLTSIENSLQDYQHEFDSNVRYFLSRLEEAKDHARLVLGQMYDALDYPQDLEQKFGFTWQYVTLSMPGQNNLLSPALYEREKAKFQNLMETTREEAILALRQEFSDLVGHLSERLTNDGESRPKVLRKSVIEKLHEFMDSFQNRNLFQDDTLSELISSTKLIINGVDVESLKSNNFLRDSIKSSMDDIKENIDEAIEDLPRRRIIMRKAA